jgi:hypothetical protein
VTVVRHIYVAPEPVPHVSFFEIQDSRLKLDQWWVVSLITNHWFNQHSSQLVSSPAQPLISRSRPVQKVHYLCRHAAAFLCRKGRKRGAWPINYQSALSDISYST